MRNGGILILNPYISNLSKAGRKERQLYKQLEQSRSEGTTMLPNNVIVFLTFCVERYALLKKITSLQAYALFRRYGVDKYLINGFDVLHTQGEETILHDIELYINNRKNNKP